MPLLPLAACPLLRPEPAHLEEESKMKAEAASGQSDKLWALMSSYLSSGALGLAWLPLFLSPWLALFVTVTFFFRPKPPTPLR